jgi:hypothetical protein
LKPVNKNVFLHVRFCQIAIMDNIPGHGPVYRTLVYRAGIYRPIVDRSIVIVLGIDKVLQFIYSPLFFFVFSADFFIEKLDVFPMVP